MKKDAKESGSVASSHPLLPVENIPMNAVDANDQHPGISELSAPGTPDTSKDLQKTVRELEKAKKELEVSHHRYKQLFNLSPEAAVVISVTGIIRDCNQAFFRMSGYAPEEIIGKHFTKTAIFSAKDLKSYLKIFASLIKKHENASYEYQWHDKSGQLHYSVAHIAPLIENNKLMGFQTISRDVTAEVITKNELLETKQRFVAYIQSSPTSVAIITREGTFQYCNPAFLRLMETDEPKQPSHTFLSYVFPADEAIAMACIQQVEKEKKLAGKAIRILTSRGQVKHILLDALFYPENDIVLYCKDITEIITANQLLEERNDRYKQLNQELNDSYNEKAALLRCLPDLMFTFSREGIIVDYHASSLQQLYVEPQYFINQPLQKVLPPYLAEVTKKAIINVLKSKQINEYTYHLPVEGKDHIFDARMVYVNEEKVLTIVRDITERQMLIEELRQAKEKAEQSDRLKSAFLANMSHEIRTPMNGIIGFSELMRDPSFSEEERNRFASSVVNSSRQLLAIVNDVLDISRIESGTMAVNMHLIAIHEFASELKKIYIQIAAEKKLQFHVNIQLNSDTSFYSDRVKVRQILDNLLSNAFKFTKQGVLTLQITGRVDSICFEVLDTGPGIPEHKLEEIFERFVQLEMEINRNYGGTGLGLSISRKLASLLGGEIRVKSKIGKGSIFTLSLPMKYEASDF
ncbi:MAG TPA: PAS domain S-box protein [Bacteroidales bacterium]|nr:PAS domain S-box protein [Bacteroidales bacterium]